MHFGQKWQKKGEKNVPAAVTQLGHTKQAEIRNNSFTIF